jgi:carboxyl-terminal processing protease
MIRRFLVLLIIGVWLSPAAMAARPTSQDSLYEQIRQNISLFGDVYREITLRYVDTIDPQKFVRAGVEGMLSTLDPYTVFIPEDETEDLDLITLGRYGGVGIEIGVRGRDKVLTVISAMDESPAQRVGIRSGDRIIQIDTVSTSGFSTSDAARLLRGAPGTQVTLLIERTGSSEPIAFLITRREIEVKDVPYYGFVQPGVGYVKLAHFSRGAADELDIALHELNTGGMHSLILDLRGNPGGLLSSAVGVLQRFCKKGDDVLAVRGRNTENDQIFRVQADPLVSEIPLVVLVDGGSASASEIVSGAIQDLDRGVLVGETTFGKGLVQSVVSFETGEALKLTTAKYYTPSGRLIQKVDYFHDEDGVVRGPVEISEHFTTRNGRPVQGGGGIMPDVVIPTPQPGPLGTELWRQGAFFDFVNEYRARHPQITSEKIGEDGMTEFRAWLDSTHFQYDSDGRAPLDSLRRMAAENGMTDSLAADFQHLEQFLETLREIAFVKEREFIRRSIEGELAASLFGSRGRIEASFDSDEPIQCSVKILSDRGEYNKLLSTATKQP